MTYLLALNAKAICSTLQFSLFFLGKVKKGTHSLVKASVVKDWLDLKARRVQIHSFELCPEGALTQALLLVRGCSAPNWTQPSAYFQGLLSPF